MAQAKTAQQLEAEVALLQAQLRDSQQDAAGSQRAREALARQVVALQGERDAALKERDAMRARAEAASRPGKLEAAKKKMRKWAEEVARLEKEG